MGLGSAKPRRKIYYMSPKAQRLVNNIKVTDPHFTVTMTDENGGKSVLKDEKSVSGYLLSIGHGDYEYPKDSGKKVKTIHLYLVDGSDLFKVEGSVNTNMMRGLMNTVAGTVKFGVMEISLYVKDDFPNLFVRNDNEKCEWRFDYKTELAPLITESPDPQDETKTVKVYHAVNRKLWDAWLETEPKVTAHAKEMGYDKAPEKKESQNSAEGLSLKDELDQLRQEDLDGGNQPFYGDNAGSGAADDLPF